MTSQPAQLRAFRAPLALILALAAILACQTRSGRSADERELERGTDLLAAGDAAAAIEVLAALNRRHPQDLRVMTYLSQAYAERAGVRGWAVLDALEGLKGGSSSAKDADLIALIPEISDQTRADVKEAAELYWRLPEEMQTKARTLPSAFYYQALWLAYLAKELKRDVDEVQALGNDVRRLGRLVEVVSRGTITESEKAAYRLSLLSQRQLPRTKKVVDRVLRGMNPKLRYRDRALAFNPQALAPDFLRRLFDQVVSIELEHTRGGLQGRLDELGLDSAEFETFAREIFDPSIGPQEAVARVIAQKGPGLLSKALEKVEDQSDRRQVLDAVVGASAMEAPSPQKLEVPPIPTLKGI